MNVASLDSSTATECKTITRSCQVQLLTYVNCLSWFTYEVISAFWNNEFILDGRLQWYQIRLSFSACKKIFSISDVICGMEALFQMTNFSGDELVNLLRASFNEIHAQSHILVNKFVWCIFYNRETSVPRKNFS